MSNKLFILDQEIVAKLSKLVNLSYLYTGVWQVY